VRRAAKRDANEAEIVAALEQVGCAVQRLNEGGVPDLLVGFRGRYHLLEVKLPLGVEGGESHRTLTPKQRAWWRGWKGPPPVIVRSVDEALRAIGVVLG